jgi:tetratricopeptide (TPR) repeat protein
MTDAARNVSLPAARAAEMDLQGDFSQAQSEYEIAASLPDYGGIGRIGRRTEVYDDASLHDYARAAQLWSQLPKPVFPQPLQYFLQTLVNISDVRIFASLHDWTGVLAMRADLEIVLGPQRKPPFTQAFADQTLSRQVWPYAAWALAHLGKMPLALTLIAKTPGDCYLCVRVRGELDATRGNWSGAAYWFAKATAQAPSIPFAYTDWGAMLLAKGDLDNAIAEFKNARDKGPHFADPLEMWGEALIAKNRSDLALAKFAEANKCAPNWGRLHLKWGEALLWSGDKDGARKQLAIADKLDLTATERAERARLRV